MGILEEVTNMERQGIPRNEIINSLQEKGFNPQEINNAFSQSQIKNAVSANPEGQGEMQQSIMDQSQQGYAPQTQEMNGQETYAPYPQEYPQQDQGEYYPSEGYEDYGAQGSETDLIIEVAEQVFSEKIKKIKSQVEEINNFKTLTQSEIIHLEERLKKIESIIEKLQITILEKIGSYGNNLENIKKEMSMMQDSFGKMVGVAAKKASEKPKTNTHKKPTHKKKNFRKK